MADGIALADVFEVRFACKGVSQYSINVRQFIVTGPLVGNPTYDDAAAAFQTKFSPLYMACLSVNASWYGCAVRRLFPTLSLESQVTLVVGGGSVTGDLLPAQTCGLVTFRTPLPGRKNRGRMYVPFASEGSNDPNGRPNAAYLGTMASLGSPLAADTLYTSGAKTFKAAGVIWHRSSRSFTQINYFANRPDWATQRRRSQINRPDAAPF